MPRIAITSVASFLALLCLGSCGRPAEEGDTSYLTHEDYPTFVRYCGSCHPVSRPLSRRFTAQGWEQIVKKMQRKDPNLIPDSEAEKITRFLQTSRLRK